MARVKKSSVASKPEATVAAFEKKRKNDIVLAWGFAVQTDSSFSVPEGVVPTKAQLMKAEDGMFIRHEEKVLEALESVFGKRVTFVEIGGSYTGDPRTGVEKRVRIAPVEPVEPIEQIEEDKENGLGQMTVKELRTLARDNNLKTQGSKAVLLKRLNNAAVDETEE